jgi:hypothetical protein
LLDAQQNNFNRRCFVSIRDDRSAFSVTTHESAAADDRAFWRAATTEARWHAVELQRMIAYGYETPPDFKEFLRLLNAHRVEYLAIGGYAVAHYGYPRPTADFDVWTAMNASNAQRAVAALADFGFAQAAFKPELLLEPGKILRMGIPPMRLEIMNTIDGVDFADCYSRRNEIRLDETTAIDLISLADLIINKKASRRAKDLDDLEYLEQ